MGDKLKIKHTRMTFDEWNRSIVKKNVYLSEDEEKRYGLIHIEKVKEKQVWGFLDGRPVVADDGFQWLVIVPKYKNYPDLGEIILRPENILNRFFRH